MSDVEDRLTALEARVETLEGRRDPDDRARGVIEYHGNVDFDGELDWTIRYDAASVLRLPTNDQVEVAAALGNPVRYALLHTLLDGACTSSELAEAVGLTSTGQLYHHLRALCSAKIVEQRGRGAYRIPPQKIVPVLVLMTAAADIAELLHH